MSLSESIAAAAVNIALVVRPLIQAFDAEHPNDGEEYSRALDAETRALEAQQAAREGALARTCKFARETYDAAWEALSEPSGSKPMEDELKVMKHWLEELLLAGSSEHEQDSPKRLVAYATDLTGKAVEVGSATAWRRAREAEALARMAVWHEGAHRNRVIDCALSSLVETEIELDKPLPLVSSLERPRPPSVATDGDSEPPF
ncbi:MAG: hypothetical protein HY791_12215 [Deltaproteobacteria bacterium]|nr:hypothetical protein [Deltaproteobacteria bacterium]